MERLKGQSLEEYLDEGGRLSVHEVLSIGIQLAGALDYAHGRGVIHRDVKPSNIYFDHQSGLVKLVDFGIAAINDRTQTNGDDVETIAGTPKYMSPEQIQGSELDGRADLYALGVVLYRLLSGTVPFDADSIGALIHQIVHRPPTRLQPRDDRTPVDLIDLVHRLLAKDPESRSASGALLLEELQEIRADLDRGLLNTVRGQPGAWRWLAALSLALMVVLGGGLTWVYHSQTEAMEESTYGYGDALTSVIARETAEALLARRHNGPVHPDFGLFQSILASPTSISLPVTAGSRRAPTLSSRENPDPSPAAPPSSASRVACACFPGRTAISSSRRRSVSTPNASAKSSWESTAISSSRPPAPP